MKWLLCFAVILLTGKKNYGETTHQISSYYNDQETTTYSAQGDGENVGKGDNNSKGKHVEPEFSHVTTIESFLTTHQPKSHRSLHINGINDSTKLIGSGTETKRSKIVIKKGENGEDFEYEYIYYYYDGNEDNIKKLTTDEENFKKTELEKIRSSNNNKPIVTKPVAAATTTTDFAITTSAKNDFLRNEINYNSRQRKKNLLSFTENSATTEEVIVSSSIRSRNRHNKNDTSYERKPSSIYLNEDQFIKLKTLADEKEIHEDIEKTTEYLGRGQTKYLPINSNSEVSNKIENNDDSMNKMALDLYAIAQNLSDKNNEIVYESKINETTSYLDSTTVEVTTTAATTTTTRATTTTELPSSTDSQNVIGNKFKLKSRYGSNRYKPSKSVISTERSSLDETVATFKSKYGRNRARTSTVTESSNEHTSSSFKPRFGSRGRPTYSTSSPHSHSFSDIDKENSEPKIYSKPRLPLSQRRRNYLSTSSSSTTTTTTSTESTGVSDEKNSEFESSKEYDTLNDTVSITSTTQKNLKTRFNSHNLIRPFRGRQNLYLRHSRPNTNDHIFFSVNHTTKNSDILMGENFEKNFKDTSENDSNKNTEQYRSHNTQRTRNVTNQFVPVITTRKPNPLLARRKLKLISSTTSTTSTTSLSPISDENLQLTELPVDDSAENDNSVLLTTTTTSAPPNITTEPRGLHKLLSNKRRLLNRNI